MGHRAVPIYLDYNASTPIDPRVAEVIHSTLLSIPGNSSSVDHVVGEKAERGVQEATRHVLQLCEAKGYRIIFTSGATESINLAVRGFTNAFIAYGKTRDRPCRIGLSRAEHTAVIASCEELQRVGSAELVFFDIDSVGRIDLRNYESKLARGIDLVCLMAANNELGTVYPTEQAARIAHTYGATFFSDATQAVGKIAFRAAPWRIDLVALSGHKLYGPQGVGALLIAPGTRVSPILFGGRQQNGMRPGTLNLPGIVGLGEACRLRHAEMGTDGSRTAAHRSFLRTMLLRSIPGLVVNTPESGTLPGTLHISVPDVPNKAVVARIRQRLAISTGSACRSGIEGPSHVLRATGLPEEVQDGALRLSLGKFTTRSELEAAAEILAEAVSQTREVMQSRSRFAS